jgi:voltage-gated potassium channel
VAGTLGYVALGFPLLDALYQTVTTVSTVGFREVQPLQGLGQLFTIGLILVGVGTVLYTLGVLIEALIEGELLDLFERRSMERKVDQMRDHVIVCGWGRVGKAIARHVGASSGEVVIVERNEDRLEGTDVPFVLGDATDDAVLQAAGIDRARALVAALDTDADNLYVTLSAKTLKPGIFVVARARAWASEEKLLRGGADRVVNPQDIGGARMAAFVLQPHVTEFLDVVMHNRSLEFRLEQVDVPPTSPLAGRTLREAHIRDKTGALVLAMRHADGTFTTNPTPETEIVGGEVLIAIGTQAQLDALLAAAAVR